MLEHKAEKLMEEMKELKAEFGKYAMGEMDFEDIFVVDPTELKLMKRLYDLMDASMNYMVDEAKAIDAIHRKLDKLIYMQKD